MPAIAVLGTGLIGGSILLRLHGLGRPVTGWDPDPAARTLGRGMGLTVEDTVAAAVAGARLVFLCGPLVTLADTLAEVVGLTGDDCVITDVGSTKAGVAAAGSRVDRFVPGHPMAGTEHFGLAAADPALFVGAPWVLCPAPVLALRHFRTLAAELIGSFDARIVPMPAEHHDRVVALSSHVPHLLAGALAGAAATSAVRDGVLGLAAGSFRDGTRVAGAPSGRTADMVLRNRAAVLSQLAEVRAALDLLTSAVSADDRDALVRGLTGGRDLRAALDARPGPAGEFAFAPDAERDFLIDVGLRGGHLTGCTPGPDSVRYRAVLPAGADVGG